MGKLEVLNDLNFGFVDSESEVNLDEKFIKTGDFDKLLDENNRLTIGGKGSGKSALFEMLTKYEKQTRLLSEGKLDNVFIVRGTGLKDVKELTTMDMENLMKEDGFDFQKVWKLYIAIKAAIKLGEESYYSGEHLVEFLKVAGELKDYRILPLLKSVWGLIVGPPPKSIPIKFKGVELIIGNSKNAIDVDDLLLEINNLLEQENKTIWVLFDKIDELFSDKVDVRKRALEGLFLTQLGFNSRFPRIKMKIFLRNDIWSTLNFVNKSHLVGKTLELKWEKEQLLEMIVSRVCSNFTVKDYIETSLNQKLDELIENNKYEEIFYQIFDKQVYKGKNEAKVFDWMIERIKDGSGNAYPRELITFGNAAVDGQKKNVIPSLDFLISGSCIKSAYYEVSKAKCETYLSEFPNLDNHFQKFRGLDKATINRTNLIDLLEGLSPDGDEAIKLLYEVGILAPKGDANTAKSFEIPRLFRYGLGLVSKGRP